MQRVDELNHRLTEEPDNPSLYFRLGKIYVETEKFGEAASALRRAVSLAPQEVKYHLLLAKTYVKQHKYVPAGKQYRQVLSLDPSNLKAHMNLGLVYEFHVRNRSRALTHYEKYVDSGGNDPRVLKRLRLLTEEMQSDRALDGGKPNATAEVVEQLQTDRREDLLKELYWKRDKWERKFLGKKEILTRVFFALSILVLLFMCLDAFPVEPAFFYSILCFAAVALTVLRPKYGITLGLGLMFLPIASYNPLMAYLYLVGILLLRRIFWQDQLGSMMLVLLMPVFLKLNVAYAVVLGAALTLDARKARTIGIAACVAGLCYLVAADLHQLGPLSANYTGTPFPVSSTETPGIGNLVSIRWIGGLISANLIDSFVDLIVAVFPAFFIPPSALIQFVAWGLTGYAAGRLYKGRRPRDLAYATGAAIGILLLQALADGVLPGSAFSFPAAARCLVFSVILVSPLAFHTLKFYETEIGEDDEDIGWDSIGGLEDVKQEIQMATQYQFRSGFSRYVRRFGLKGVRGILFFGPPGCGKTMFAKVLATETGVSFFSITGSDFRSKWYGETEQNLSNCFKEGRRNAPSILFFDEIDAILTSRSDNTLGDSPEKGIRALFLTEMDGVKSSGGVMVVGATNEPESIDPAALRPGRFDNLIYIPLPDEEGRKSIFRIHLRKKPLAGIAHFDKLAKMTERFSGADIADVCSKVAEQSMRESLESGQTTRLTMDALMAQIKMTKPSTSLESIRRYEELKEKYSRRTLKSETGAAERKEKYSWEQIGGLGHLKKELVEVVETPLKRPELYEKYKITPPKGVLFYGPPGCGKTLTAKIVASQCGAHFLSVDTKKETGESIKNWFIRARENKPSVLFFDEIDSIATSRDIGIVPDQGVVPQLLIEMDGMEELKQVIVIAATNRPDHIDGALMRPGRFDRLIYVPPPDEKARLKILKIHFKGKPLAKDVNLRAIAQKTENYSGADLAALCYEASMSLIRNPERPNPRVTMQDVLSAIEKIKSSIMPDELEYFEEMKERYSRG